MDEILLFIVVKNTVFILFSASFLFLQGVREKVNCKVCFCFYTN